LNSKPNVNDTYGMEEDFDLIASLGEDGEDTDESTDPVKKDKNKYMKEE